MVLGTAACATDVVNSYGAQAKANFLVGCTTTAVVKNAKLQRTESLASKSTCTCVYDYISSSKHQLAFGDLTDYESKVADAANGSPPAMPKVLADGIRSCSQTGPTVPKTHAVTTTTAAG